MSQLTEINITSKQRKFAELLVKYDGEKSATECAILSGYPKRQLEYMLVDYNQLKSFQRLLIIYHC